MTGSGGEGGLRPPDNGLLAGVPGGEGVAIAIAKDIGADDHATVEALFAEVAAESAGYWEYSPSRIALLVAFDNGGTGMLAGRPVCREEIAEVALLTA